MSKKKSSGKKKKSKTSDSDLLKGRLDITRSGMGFVIIENQEQDILIRPNDFNTAMHGDTVRVKITRMAGRTGRMQGIVTEVVDRKQNVFMGKVEISKTFAFFVADSDKPMPDIYIPLNSLHGAENGARVIVRVVEWAPGKKPVGEVVEVLEAQAENDLAMKEIIMENGFPMTFPEDVIEETARIPEQLAGVEVKKRRDFRDVLTFTIDPVDAKDFDDALSIRKVKTGYEIGVHIADVSYYVEPDTELDKEAYLRATSVYLPDRVNPMLPERISNELCSLRPHEDKFTFSAVFNISATGSVKDYWLGRTVIHSDHRFTYEEVQEVIENGDGLYKEELLLLNKFAQKYRKQRFKKGAINFSSQEVRFKLDEHRKPIGIIVKESKEAHQLIEEFMLLANRTVAEHVGKFEQDNKQLPFPYRVHDQPDAEKLVPFAAFARKFGHGFDTKSPERIAASFNQLLEEVKGMPQQHVLEQLGIRTMAKAVYTTKNIGHYGLGFENYCHFTSPIRRYPDVLVHRVLQEVLDGRFAPDKKMEEKCKHSSERERAAMDAERAGNKYKQVEYLQNFLGDEFDGVISGVSSFGFWVETVEHKCEGLVSIASLSDYDDFRHVESEYMLAGRRSGRTFRMGDKIKIRVVAANLEKRQLDYEWVITAALKEDTGSGERLKRVAKKSRKKK
ncbi:ribonuclease R [Flavihumibacter stibioxidans]|uniref:Ribonuclease R n=1 Tax=Flavihumibacter stibioxidans TaxID=1834163 RepID=A0ABR7M3X1_9BACT|nr:ribonuclease R [Flavihumibacter stibioxidans]MBC6489723.1 ribonuclease R [Flavihumibacter stibioxidans]